jgi:hypothetical protein
MSGKPPLVLELPVPPSPNQAPRHPMQFTKWKNGTKRAIWFAALQQERPLTEPPARVAITAVFRLSRLRDPDNLTASLKYVLDALRVPGPGDRANWRQGIAERKGYFLDDSPKHLTLRNVAQRVTSLHEEPSLRLEIDPT